MQRNLTRNLPQLARHFSRNNSASSKIEIPMVRTFFSRWLPDPYLENRTKEMERYFDRLERDLFSGFGSNFLNRRFTSPLSGNLYSFFNFPVAVESRVSSEPGENGKPGKYTFQLDLGTHFSPDDIKMTLKERHLTIEAKLQIKSEDGSSKVYHEINRQYDLPDGIKPEEVKCFVTNGVISIEAPLAEVEPPQPK